MSGERNVGNHVVVIGGGVIGVCCASWLLRDGHAVTLLEPDGIALGSSFGNAGCFNPSSVVPMSMPGNLPKVPGWLLDPLGPLSIRWSYLPAIAPWLIRFLRAGTPERVPQQAAALAPLLKDSPDAYRPLVENAGATDLMRRDGHIMAYRTRADFEADALAWKLRSDHDIEYQVLEGDAFWEWEPAISQSYGLGVFLPGNGHTVNPHRLVNALADAFVRDGGRIRRGRALDFATTAGRLTAVKTDDGLLPADRAVIAAGARSKALAAQLGDIVPLDTERGYHISIASPGVAPRAPVLDTAGKFIATPMETGLRLAGTVEFAGLDAPPNWDRARNLLTLARRLLPGLREVRSDETPSTWMGFRPSMPDSLPVIGHAKSTRDIVYAFGHGHIGMASGATTGRVVADLIGGRTPSILVEPFSPRRFS